MTDTFDVGPDPSDFIRRNRQRVMGEAMTSLEDDPQKVGRAYELGRATGDSPALVYADLDNYEAQHKAALTSQLLNSNDHLREYIDADPMHAKLSNDDYANLDTVSAKLKELRGIGNRSDFGFLMKPGQEGVLDAAMRGFVDTLRETQVQGSRLKTEDIKTYPFGSAVLQTAMAPFDIIGGVFKGLTEGIKAGAEQITGDPQLARDLAGMAEMQLMGQGVHAFPKPTAKGVAEGNMNLWDRNPEYRKAAEQAYKAAQDTKLWLDSAKEPPPGLNRDIDKIKLDQNNADIKYLDEAVRDAQSSATRERDPDTFARFIRMRDEGTIAIDSEAVGKLYGDKVPHGEDGLLGWEPSLEGQLATAKATGADIEIPIADFLAKVDPEVYKALKDDIRVRPGGITKNEAKVASEQRAEVEGSREVLPEDLPQLRAHAGLEPLFSIGDRKLALEKQAREPRPYDDANFKPHDFKFLDENGKTVGSLSLTEYKGGEDIHVDMIMGLGVGPTEFGPALIRDLLRQIKAEFPNAKRLGGYRVSGAREKAGMFDDAWIKLEAELADPKALRDILDGAWENIGGGIEANFNVDAKTKADIIRAVSNELARMTPTAEATPVSGFREGGKGRKIQGAYVQYSNRAPEILYSLAADDPIGVARHEGIHHLRREGFFTPEEWNILTRAARDNEWQTKFNIDARYPKLDQPTKLEEAIADGYKAWVKGGETAPKLAPIFEKLKALLDSIVAKIKEILGREPTWEELFGKVQAGEIGGRAGAEPIGSSFRKEMEALSVEEPIPADERPLFRTPATIGMTAKQANLYARRLREMHDSDIEWAQGRAEADQRKRLTAEWKQDYKNTRSEVEADMNARPDVAADLFFGRGELYGEKLPQKVKIGWDDLTPEERAGLPKDYITKAGVEGVPLDDIASLVGFPSGKAMIEHLVAYNQAKLSANMSAKAFRDRMVDLETDRQMAGKHGDLQENILDAAKDQVTSETQLNLIGEEVLALGIRGGGEASINKAQLKEWISDRFAESPMSAQSSDKYLKAAGKGGTAAEIALLKEDFAEAYRAKQQQYYAMMMAQEARKLEKEQKQFGNLAKRLGKRDVKGLDQEYQDVIQSLLWQGGLTPRRTMLEIQRSQAQSGFTSLDTFVDSARGDGWAPEVAEDIIAGRMKPLDQMTVEEFREFKDAITSLNWIGRQVEKINVKGAAEDFATYRDKVVSNITSLPRRSRESQESGLAHRMYSIDATLTRMENLMKDLDLGEDMGPLVDATIRPMAEAKHKEYSLQEGLSRQIKDLNGKMPKEWKKGLDEALPNDWFQNPGEGNLFKLSRMDLLNIMLNWGNKGNLKKFTHGYGSPDPVRQATTAEAAAFQTKMKAYIDTHATRDDWKFVQGVWDIYKGYRADMEQVWRNTAGTQPKLVEPVPVDTPHGTFEGGYYPLIRDQYMSPLPKKGTGEELFGPDYPSFSTPQGHLKERTGATYFVDFQQPLGRIPMRMQQVIHDIAYRDAVMATAKVVRDKSIKGAIINHYGKEYADQLEPWLQKTARGSTIDEANQKGIDSILRQARLNLVGYALPWNYVVTLTPDVGSINPMAMKRYYADKANNEALANRLSKEIPHAMYNMDRDFKEAMQRAVGEGKLDEYKVKVARWGYGPVSWASKQFRTVTFIEKFNEAQAEGKSEVEAAAIADTYVRERHGAVALHDLPSVMSTGEKGRLLTMFYGYFNTQYNWTRTIPGHIRRGDYQEALKVAWGSIIVGSFFGATIANQAHEEDTWVKRGIKSVPLQLLGMVPFAREFATLAIEGIPPRTPVGSVLQSVVGAAGDVKRYIENKPIDSGVKHVAALAGLLGGVPGTLQGGRTGQFLWDVNRGKQRPRDLMEWSRGIMTGEARLKHKGER